MCIWSSKAKATSWQAPLACSGRWFTPSGSCQPSFPGCLADVWGWWRCHIDWKQLKRVVRFSYCLFFQCPLIRENAYIRGVWIVSGKCLGVSEWCRRVSGRCLGWYRCHMNWKQLNKSRYIHLFLFLPVTSLGQIGAECPVWFFEESRWLIWS